MEWKPVHLTASMTVHEEPRSQRRRSVPAASLALLVFGDPRYGQAEAAATEPALGRELAGEGIIGLMRAFQYAGARSVAASLWSVPDRSTALLMERFYVYLKQGLAKDEALRAAQIDLIKGAATGRPGPSGETRGMKRLAKSGDTPVSCASPFYWAAFQLYGDWK